MHVMNIAVTCVLLNLQIVNKFKKLKKLEFRKKGRNVISQLEQRDKCQNNSKFESRATRLLTEFK